MTVVTCGGTEPVRQSRWTWPQASEWSERWDFGCVHDWQGERQLTASRLQWRCRETHFNKLKYSFSLRHEQVRSAIAAEVM